MADLRGPLLENIAFLSQFANRGRALRDPVVNLQPLITRPRQGEASVKRLLNFDQERRLAEAFALVLATNEIAAQVMAICIEQKPDRTGFTVRIATNSGLSDNKQQLFNKIIAAARLEIKSSASPSVYCKGKSSPQQMKTYRYLPRLSRQISHAF